jgi:L-asparaginase
MLQHLTIVTTGGAIDKIYFDDKSTFQIGAPQIGEILTALGVAFPFDVVPAMRAEHDPRATAAGRRFAKHGLLG